MKTLNEQQMGDPWEWCRAVLERQVVTSKVLSDAIDAPQSTIRALYNGTTANPSYGLLKDIIGICILIENGEMQFLRKPVKTVPKKVAPEQPTETEYDFL